MDALSWGFRAGWVSHSIMMSSIVLTLAACASTVPNSGTAPQSLRSGRPAATMSESAASVSASSQPPPSPSPETSPGATYGAINWWDRIVPPTTCPVTKSTGATPPASLGQLPPPRASAPVPWSDAWYGNEALWTQLSKTGVIPEIQGSVKWPWWIVIGGPFKVTATLRDNPGASLTGDVPSGYGSMGFQPSGLDLPKLGCWTITGTVSGEPPLSITVWVQEQPS